MTGVGDWSDALAEIEAALVRGDADAVAAVPISSALGPVPAHLEERASNVLGQIASLQAALGTRRDALEAELGRVGHRGRRVGPPAPSQLDCSA